MDFTDENIPALKIEPSEDGTLMLEQDWCGNVDRIAIHPIHLRYMAERLGLLPSGDLEASRTIASLTRRLHVLHGRIEHLADWLSLHADHQHADLSYEVAYARATADVADEFCADLAPAAGDPPARPKEDGYRQPAPDSRPSAPHE